MLRMSIDIFAVNHELKVLPEISGLKTIHKHHKS